MRRVLLATAVAAAACCAGARAATPVQIMPGVTVTKTVEFTPHGAVAMTVIAGPQPSGLYALAPVLAHGTIVGGLERVTQIQRDVSPQATVVGVDGDTFSAADGHPSGIVLQNGALAHAPVATRASIGVDGAGALHVGRLRFFGTWRGTGQRRTLNGIDQPPVPGAVALFTPAYGPRTPAVAGAAQVVLDPFPAATPNTDLSATVQAVVGAGATAIPADGAVLMATGSAAAKLTAEAPVGTSVAIRLGLQPAWPGVVATLGGGPALLADGKPIFRTTETDFGNAFLTTRTARAAVGQTADGRILLVAVDGGQPGYSVGLTSYELAQAMVRLGAVTASSLGGGNAATAAFDGRLLNRPSARGGELPVKEALLLEYFGVYAPEPSLPLVNGDPGLDVETLAYKIVRPSTVAAVLVGPDGTQTTVDSGPRPAGTYTFTQPTFALEGTWHWTVSATDDLARTSTIDRTFRYDATLRGLTPPRATRGTATVRFTLSRPASVQLQVETPTGVAVRTLPARQLPAGPGSLVWDGRLPGGSPAYGGSYVAHLTVTSSVGTSDLSAPFGFRR